METVPISERTEFKLPPEPLPNENTDKAKTPLEAVCDIVQEQTAILRDLNRAMCGMHECMSYMSGALREMRDEEGPEEPKSPTFQFGTRSYFKVGPFHLSIATGEPKNPHG